MEGSDSFRAACGSQDAKVFKYLRYVPQISPKRMLAQARTCPGKQSRGEGEEQGAVATHFHG